MMTELPERVVFMQGSDTRASDDRLLKWSGPKGRPIPVVGEVITTPNMAYYRGVGSKVIGPMTVVGYAVEHGWLYVLCRPVKAPKGLPRSQDPIYVAGVDLGGGAYGK